MPLDLPSYLLPGSKTKLVPIISSARALKIVCEKWQTHYNYLPDAVVLEGPKAGGHLGYKLNQIFDNNYSLESTLPQVVAQAKYYEDKYDKKIPVIAGGGIYTGADIRKFINLGASGVQMGTRFVTTKECDVSDAFKQTYIKAKKKDIEIIISPVGMPGRAIHNSYLERVHQGLERPTKCPVNCIRTCNMTDSQYCINVALFNAYKGNMAKGYAFSGANAWKIKSILTVKQLFKLLMLQFNRVK